MSANMAVKRLTAPKIRAMKGGEPVVALTAYTAAMASMLDDHCDILLVGDSVGMVFYGYDSTLPVTLDMMIAHGAAVVRGSRKAMIVIDMPFGSYEESPQVAFRNAARILAETGAGAVKLEGGVHMADTIFFLTKRGIPVMAHVGLTPQSVNAFGGYAARGMAEGEYQRIIDDAVAVDQAGAFSTVIEGVADTMGGEITEKVGNITIGIGASKACDGQVLVTDDMLGMFPRTARFVKRYADLGTIIADAAKSFAEDVRERRFPSEEHTYKRKK